MHSFEKVSNFRSAIRCRKYLVAASKEGASILLVIGLSGCKTCGDLKQGLLNVQLTVNNTKISLRHLQLVFVKINQPEQLFDLGFFPKEFPTTLLLSAGKVVKGWAGFIEVENRAVQAAFAQALILQELREFIFEQNIIELGPFQ